MQRFKTLVGIFAIVFLVGALAALAQSGVSWTPGVWCPPDVDYSATIGGGDIATVKGNWGRIIDLQTGLPPTGDANLDGAVGGADIAMVIAYYGKSCSRLWTGTDQWHAANPCPEGLYLENNIGETINPVDPNTCVATLQEGPWTLRCLNGWSQPITETASLTPPFDFCGDVDESPTS
jgi:hypothetical protein